MPALIALGSLALVLRSISYESTLATALVGFLGVVAGRSSKSVSRVSAAQWVTVTAAGIAAFWVGRALGNGVGVRLTSFGILTIVVAAVAEELFFRRFVYGWAVRWGAPVAIAVSAGLFAVIHLPTYGSHVFLINVAAGGVFGWQRWASGTWTAPGATHVFANLLQMG